MRIRSKLVSIALLGLLVFFTVYRGLPGRGSLQEHAEESKAEGIKLSEAEADAGTLLKDEKETIIFWYTDEALTDYLNSCALEYMETHENLRVVPTLVSAVEYVENIYEASVRQEDFPDLFIVTNDCLEKAYLGGLATEIGDEAQCVNKELFPQTAISAVTYDGKIVAYPMYFETSLFLYNKSYLETMAETKAQLPKTFNELLALADEYDAPQEVEAILRWDVSDIFYNYFFAGNYMNVGGENGDDAKQVDISNELTVECLNVYQGLNQFFSIDSKETDYAKVLNAFIEGKTVFTVATTDAIAALDQAKEDGSFAWEYGIAPLPDVTGELKSKGLSVTDCVAINGFGDHIREANDFAGFLVTKDDGSLYARAGKPAACKKAAQGDEKLEAVMTAYEQSTSLPKLMRASNFWVWLEAAYTDIWNGKDTKEVLDGLQEKMQLQLQQ